MGKKSKKKNVNKHVEHTKNNSNNVIVQTDVAEGQNVEEYCDDKIKEANSYYDQKIKESDNYYEQKLKEADNYYEQKRKEAEQLKESLDDREEKLVKDLEECIKEKAALENKTKTYRKEQLEKIQNEIDDICADKNELELKNKKLLQEIEILKVSNESYSEDIKNFKEQMKLSAKNKGNDASHKYEIISLKEEIESTKKLYLDESAKCNEMLNLLLKCGDDPEKIINRNVELERKVNELGETLNRYPSEEEIDKLKETKREYDLLKSKCKQLDLKIQQLENERETLELEKQDIDNKASMIELLKVQKEELENELNKTLDLYKNNVESVFATLSAIDKEVYSSYENDEKITLKELCQKFRGYLSNRQRNPLYYDETTIRTFIAGLASSRTMILEGLSGTGKTRLPMSFRDFAGVKVEVISVQSSWKDRNDLLGYYNDFKKQYKETEFLKAIYRAACDPNNIYLIVLDELNLSRIEYYFADFLSVLEKDENDWEIDLISDYASVVNSHSVFPQRIHNGKLKIGNNVWFVGTANKDDSTFMISDKVYDRSTVLYFDKKGEKINIEKSNTIQLNKDTLIRLLVDASKFKNNQDNDKCMKIVRELDRKIKEKFDITFGNRIENQIKKFVPAYMECGGSIEEAIDVIFSRKILRKLDGIYDENTKKNLEELYEFIDETYNNKMPLSCEKLEKLIETK